MWSSLHGVIPWANFAGPQTLFPRFRKLTGAPRRSRVFYDLAEEEVVVIAVLHKRETARFYREDAP
jgi:hypothetical protein